MHAKIKKSSHSQFNAIEITFAEAVVVKPCLSHSVVQIELGQGSLNLA